ncbi:hypothetical protein, conserved [Eimeria brunetti]|uniref:RAP domain-containing protein n=1 Tax=Eimeria brunetti TaxID=51314 RepID=U6LRG5_9EIME|nr:hypothetical protein, conserved [Eimeria brunetti]
MAPQLAALSSSLLQQWQQQKYEGFPAAAGGDADSQQQQQQLLQQQQQQQQYLDGGLDDETEIAILHCLLTEECFSDTIRSCFFRCVEHIRDKVLAARVRGAPPPLSPSAYCALYEACGALVLLGGVSSGIDPTQQQQQQQQQQQEMQRELLAFCQHDTPKAFWHQQQRMLLGSFVSSAVYVQLKEALAAADLPGLQPLLTSCGFCHFAAAAKPVRNPTGPPVAGLAFVCVPEEETVAVSSRAPPLLLQQQQLQHCCGRSRLLLRLLQKANWAAVPIFLEQWTRLPTLELRAAYLKALTTGEAD